MKQKNRKELREILNDVLKGHTAEVNGKFEVIKTELSIIKEQTTKTNGRVNDLDGEVNKLKGNDLSRSAVWKFAGKVGVIIVIPIGVIVAVIELLIKM